MNALSRAPADNRAEARNQALVAFAIGMAAACALLGLRGTGMFERLELAVFDVAMAGASTTPSSRVAVVAIDETDIQHLGHWPLTDADLARILDTVGGFQPRAIGVDIYRDIPVGAGNAQLAGILADDPRVVSVFKFESAASRGVAAPPAAPSERTGFNDFVIDPDGVVRRGLIYLDNGGDVATSFAMRLAERYLAGHGVGILADSADPTRFRLGEVVFAPLEPNDGGYHDSDAAGYQFLLGPLAQIPVVSLAELEAGADSGRAIEQLLRDRVVVVGVDAVSVKDAFLVTSSRLTGGPLGGAMLHGAVADQLIAAALDGRAPPAFLSERQEMLLIFAAALLAAFAGFSARTVSRLVVAVSIGAAATALLAVAVRISNVWLPSAAIALAAGAAFAAVVAYVVHRERRDRMALRQIFASQVSPQIADAIWARRRELLRDGKLLPQELTASVLFMDLEGFTSVSESRSSAALMAWLQRILDEASRVISAHGGIVDDYFGDGIKANFGVPFGRATEAEIDADAQAAVRCALALSTAAQRLNSSRDAGDPAYSVRVGVHTGIVTMGSVGNRERLKYTSIGDTVNVAARLEGAGKNFAGVTHSIVVSGTTAARVQGAFQLSAKGHIQLKGRNESVEAFVVERPLNQAGASHVESHRPDSDRSAAVAVRGS